MPTQERLRELFDYREGRLFHRTSRGSAAAGKEIGGLNNQGYRKAKVEKRWYKVHRLIWVWHYGSIPPGLVVDHIDGRRTNNRIDNLRLLTVGDNSRHRVVNPQDGIYFENGKWTLRLVIAGRRHTLGRHTTFEAAQATRRLVAPYLW